MVAVHILHLLWTERTTVRHLLRNFRPQVHALSEDLDGHGTKSYPGFVPGDVPHGPGHHHKHDGFCVRAFLGWTVVEIHLGGLVD